MFGIFKIVYGSYVAIVSLLTENRLEAMLLPPAVIEFTTHFHFSIHP